MTSYDKTLDHHLENGWIVIFEGPAGAQLKKTKKPTALVAFVILGVICIPLIHWFLGIFIIILGVIIHAFLIKDQSKFLRRDTPGVESWENRQANRNLKNFK